MGMDVYGKNPKTEAGKYFRANVWGWHPLAEYVCNVAPSIAGKCEFWHSNDGDGLGAEDSKKLARVLRDKLASGEVSKHVALVEAKKASLPLEDCIHCGGTGDRQGWVHYKDENGAVLTLEDVDCLLRSLGFKVSDGNTRVAMIEKAGLKLVRAFNDDWAKDCNGCNACNGRGRRESLIASYSIHESTVREFANFLEDCGGFEIC